MPEFFTPGCCIPFPENHELTAHTTTATNAAMSIIIHPTDDVAPGDFNPGPVGPAPGFFNRFFF